MAQSLGYLLHRHGDQRYPLKTVGVVAQAYHPSVGEAEADLADLPADYPP